MRRSQTQSFVRQGPSMTRLGKFILFAVALWLTSSEDLTSIATSAVTAKFTNESHESTQRAEQNIYDGSLFPAVKDGKYGFIDIKGNFVIPPMFTSAGFFIEGLAKVMVGGQSYIDEGRKIGQFIASEKGKWGYIDPTGIFKIPPQFTAADRFSEGLARVSINDNGSKKEKWGYIDPTGTLKIPPQFTSADSFSESLYHRRCRTYS